MKIPAPVRGFVNEYLLSFFQRLPVSQNDRFHDFEGAGYRLGHRLRPATRSLERASWSPHFLSEAAVEKILNLFERPRREIMCASPRTAGSLHTPAR